MPSPSPYPAVHSFFMWLASANPPFAPASHTSSGALAARKHVKGNHADEAHYQSILTEYTARWGTTIDEEYYYYEVFIPSQYQRESPRRPVQQQPP